MSHVEKEDNYKEVKYFSVLHFVWSNGGLMHDSAVISASVQNSFTWDASLFSREMVCTFWKGPPPLGLHDTCCEGL